jgi:hypothetical protein
MLAGNVVYDLLCNAPPETQSAARLGKPQSNLRIRNHGSHSRNRNRHRL